MKKILSMCAAVAAMMMAVTLQSCEKEDVISSENFAIGQELQVNAFIASPATKATNEVATTSTNSLVSFLMYSYSDGNEVIGGATYEKKDNKWSTANTYYWNSVGKYKFYAWAENNGAVNAFTGGNTGITKDGLWVGAAATPFKVAKSGKQNDPVYAVTTADKAPTSGKIDLNFYHLLSRVRVEPTVTIDDTVKLKAKVISWEFKGVGTEGYFDKTATASNVGWKTTATGNVTNDYSKDTLSWNNVIPGASVVETLVLKVEFSDLDDVKIADRYLTVKKADIVSAVDKYAQGYQYTYKLTVKNDGGDDDTDGDDPDEPLSKYKIVVNEVTVEAWQDAVGGTYTFTNKAN